MSEYKVLIGCNWWDKAEDKKRRAGKTYREHRAEVGDTVTTKDLAGANVKDLVAAGALELIVKVK